jgi:hypothetical protein
LPTAAAAIAGTAGWIVGYRLVHDDLVERQAVGFSGGRQFGFVIFLALVAGGLAHWIARRVLLGPKLTKAAWAIYRAPGSVHLDRQALLTRLDGYGYVASVVDDGERAPGRLVLRHRRGRHGGVIIDLGPLARDGYGTVEANDPGGELYAEMARFTMFELGRLLPGLTFRGDTSALTPESTDTLEPMLPDRPHALR